MAKSNRVTVPSVLNRKFNPPKITVLTAYDYTFARLIDACGIDIILVGDSLSCVVQGNETTLPVTLDEMIYHCRCVVRGVSRALVVGDMPFMSYQVSKEEALRSACRLIKEGGVSAVKLEGGASTVETVSALTSVDIPVIGHVGLTPQSYHRMGGNRVQGRTEDSRNRVINDAVSFEQAGAFAVVIESVPDSLAAEITSLLGIPTIGIGAGAKCDGQVLVINDLLGLDPDFHPRFVKRYANLGEQIRSAVFDYKSEVEREIFPAADNAFKDRKKGALKAVARRTSNLQLAPSGKLHF